MAFVRRCPTLLAPECSDKIVGLVRRLTQRKKRRTPVGSIDDYYAFVSQLDSVLRRTRLASTARART